LGKSSQTNHIHMIDTPDKQPADPVSIVFRKGNRYDLRIKIEIGIDQTYMKFLNPDGQTLANSCSYPNNI